MYTNIVAGAMSPATVGCYPSDMLEASDSPATIHGRVPLPFQGRGQGLGHRPYCSREPEIARAMTSCWISDVPSKMVYTFESRCQRSSGASRT